MKNKTSEELLDEFEYVITEWVKAVNGWNRRSEGRLSKSHEKLKAEILRRMDGGPSLDQ